MQSLMKATESEISITAPWGNIAGLTWGHPNNPPVLLCHGKLDACSGFRPLVSLLPDSFFYVSIDLPGNGRSDHLPKGVQYTVIDLVPTLVKVMEHYKWDKFIYIGHSLGAVTGKFFNFVYPNRISKMVEVDPIPAHHTWPTSPEGIRNWYNRYYQYYNDDRYRKFNGGEDTAPKYTYGQAQELVMRSRGLTKETADHVLERCLVTTGDGLYRFTHDQRMKEVTILPFSGEILRQLYTSATVPTFCVLAQDIINEGEYDTVPFIKDEKAWPNGNYSFKIVSGGHDVHIYNPDCMADDISKFILEEKSKL